MNNSFEQYSSLRNRALAVCLAGSLAMGSMVGVGSADINISGHSVPQTEADPTDTSSATIAEEQCADKLSLGFLAGQVLMIGVEADAMSDQAGIFKRYHVGGATLMTAPNNLYDSSIKSFKKDGGSKGDPVLISTDEEGGEVQRFSALGSLPAPEQVASTISTKRVQHLVKDIGYKMKAIGVDMVLGPLADVSPDTGEGSLGNRVFSSNPFTVSAYDQAYVRGWEAAGLLPTLKHFPGMGSASGDTDYEAATTPPLSSLKKRDFIPYKKLANSGAAVMVGNQNVPGWFKGPASLSSVVNKYLRKTLGYKNNLIVTDALNAAAVTQIATEPHAVVDAIAAGDSMALVVEPSNDSYQDAELIESLENGLKAAVYKGALTKRKLAQAAVYKLVAQHINPCTLIVKP
jgi:beta-N-acetylhexosaminidase